MNVKKIVAPLALFAAATLSLTACAANETGSGAAGGSGLTGTLSGKGASSAKAAQDAWRAAFQTKNPGVTVNYSPDGSGAGREAFIAGAVAFAGSDRALKDSEMGAGKFGKCAADGNALNLPIYVSPIAVIYNVDGVKDLKLDSETVAGIFAGKITKWNDPKIVATNPGVTLPEATITAVHRADDSGTTNNFTDYLNKAAPSVWSTPASDTFPKAAGGEAANGTSGVVDTVKNGKNTIGYADESAAGALSTAKLKVGDTYLGPTADAAAKIVEASPQAPNRAANDLAIALDRKAAGAYPAVLVSYAIVCDHYKDAADAKLVKAYLGYVASNEGQALAGQKAGSAPLSTAMAAKVKTAIDSIK